MRDTLGAALRESQQWQPTPQQVAEWLTTPRGFVSASAISPDGVEERALAKDGQRAANANQMGSGLGLEELGAAMHGWTRGSLRSGPAPLPPALFAAHAADWFVSPGVVGIRTSATIKLGVPVVDDCPPYSGGMSRTRPFNMPDASAIGQCALETGCAPPEAFTFQDCAPCQGVVVVNSYDRLFSSCSDELSDVLNAAFCILRESLDIVRWVACLVFGADGECLVRACTQETVYNLYCSEERNPWGPCNSVAWTSYVTSTIAVCTTHPAIQKYAAVFRCGSATERLCVAVDLAATLFHEFTHLCLLNTDDPAGVDCDKRSSYRAENTFRWALLQRYKRAMEAPCCQALYGDGAGGLDPAFVNSTSSFTIVEVTPENQCGLSC